MNVLCNKFFCSMNGWTWTRKLFLYFFLSFCLTGPLNIESSLILRIYNMLCLITYANFCEPGIEKMT